MEIPDRLFELHFLDKQFINIGEIITSRDSIIFDKIEIPECYPMNTGYVILKGRTDENGIYEDNWLCFELKGDGNVYSCEIPLDELGNCEYDVFFKSVNENSIPNEFRIAETNISHISNNSSGVQIAFTSDDYLKVKRLSGPKAILKRIPYLGRVIRR